jgi:glycosyltransferase involved in cell wall biosynthesis
VRSVLAQTYTNIEIVVVVDGPDQLTVQALDELNEPRLHVVALEQNAGGSMARNMGVREARGEWIAFLDDDDEWIAEKTQKQLCAALELAKPLAFVACQYIDRGRLGQRVMPLVNKNPGQHFSEFLFCRDGLFGGTGYVQTSTWFVSKKLAEECPFTPGLKRNQDVDWMLRAMSLPGAVFKLVREPLSIFNCVQDAGRVSKAADWEFHYRWAIGNRKYFSKSALSYFLSTICVEDAVKQGRRMAAAPQLLRAIFVHGRVSFKCCCFFLYYWLLSERLRQRLRTAVARIRSRGTRRLSCA